MLKLKDKRVLLTGGSRRVVQVITESLIGCGAFVAIAEHWKYTKDIFLHPDLLPIRQL